MAVETATITQKEHIPAKPKEVYDVLTNAETVVPASAGPLLSNLVIDYIQQQHAVATEVEGRIRTV